MIGRARGTVVATRGATLEARVPAVRVGEGVSVGAAGGTLAARVGAVNGDRVFLTAFAGLAGIAAGDPVAVDPAALTVPLGTGLLGRAIDAAGLPLDGGPPVRARRSRVELETAVPSQRRPCREACWTGVRALDGPLAFARGARVGVFGAPGAGKSTLLDAIVRHAEADAVVVALVGERGREAERRIAACDARTTIVCAAADRPAAERVRAAEIAFVQAAALRARGLHVLLVVDSLARVAAAAREIGLALGEPVGRGGYPPSAFALLARLLETVGASAEGSVTAVVSVLCDGGDDRDPVSDAARSLLDGHLVLSEVVAQAGRFPALDIPRSASRTLADAVPPSHLRAAALLRAAVAALDASREARALGLDPSAGDPALARAVACEGEIERFLRQDGAPSPPADTLRALLRLTEMLDDGRRL